MSDFFVQFLNGVTIAMSIYLIASGLSLVFGVLGVLNFAHGSLYMFGSFLLFTLTHHVFGTSSSFWVGLLVVPMLVALLGAVLEIGLLRFIYKADPVPVTPHVWPGADHERPGQAHLGSGKPIGVTT